MSLQRKIKIRTRRRQFRVRNAQVSRGLKFRITVQRSLNHIYAQVIDDNTAKTVASCSSLVMTTLTGDKKEVARQVGVALGKLAIAQNVSNVFFDRGAYLYHGRIKAIADGLRESGLNF